MVKRKQKRFISGLIVMMNRQASQKVSQRIQSTGIKLIDYDIY